MLELTSTSEPSPRPNAPQLSEAFPGLTREEYGRAGGYLPPPPPSPFLPSPALITIGLNCWLPRRSIGTAGVIESLLRRAGLRSTGSDGRTHTCTQMRLMFLLSGEDSMKYLSSWGAYACPEEYWVGELTGSSIIYVTHHVIFISPKNFRRFSEHYVLECMYLVVQSKAECNEMYSLKHMEVLK